MTDIQPSDSASNPSDFDDLPTEPDFVHEPRLWRDDGWTAKVIKNENDEGWAVAMTLDGESDPALVGPWTMGRDKKNPKPLDGSAFITLVKTAREVLRRHEQQLRAQLHKNVTVSGPDNRKITVSLDIIPEEDDAYAILAARDEYGESLGECRVAPTFKLNPASAERWIENDFRKPT